jgi:hypothetical protein
VAITVPFRRVPISVHRLYIGNSMLRSTVTSPCLRDCAPSCEVVDDKDQLMVMVAVQDFDVDAALGHSPCEQAELTWNGLLQSLDEYLPFGDDADASRFKCLSRSGPVLEEEMGDAHAINDPGPPTLDAHAGAAQCFTHFGESAGSVIQCNR